MKLLTLSKTLIVSLLLILPIPAQDLGELFKVISIADGDTITLLSSDKKQVKVRLEGIDAPERGQEYASISKTTLGNLLKKDGGKAYLVKSGTDKYGRTLGKIYTQDKRYVFL